MTTIAAILWLTLPELDAILTNIMVIKTLNDH